MQARFHVLFCLIGKFVSCHTKKHVYVHVFLYKNQGGRVWRNIRLSTII